VSEVTSDVSDPDVPGGGSGDDLGDLLDDAVGRGHNIYDDTPGASRPAAGLGRGYLEEVYSAFQLQPGEWPRAAALGVEWHTAGCDLVGLVRETARLGRAIEDVLDEKKSLGAADRRRLRVITDEAQARALDAFHSAVRGRRDRWLSYFAHEMRNALNTLVNAHWILRNGEGKNTAKVSDMADRAVRKLETYVKDVRDLESQVQKPAPGRPDLV
jgi:hypothetical protein